MTNLVDRLRGGWGDANEVCLAAADEIERLQKSVDTLNAANRFLSEQLEAERSTHEPTGPASLVGALQDVVHTDPGPVRAGRSVRVEPSPARTDHAENLAKALEHYLSAHDTMSAVQDSDEVTGRGEASDCGLQDKVNDAWRAMRTSLHEYRKHRKPSQPEPPACECLVRDKSPSAYHWTGCPRFNPELL